MTPDDETDLTDDGAATPSAKPTKRRVAVRSVAVALTVVTSVMVVIGAAAVRYLVGDTAAPTLEIRPGSAPPVRPPGQPALPTPIQPRVLKPHVDARRDGTQQPLDARTTGLTPAAPSGIALRPDGEAPAPRTAVQPGGRYR